MSAALHTSRQRIPAPRATRRRYSRLEADRGRAVAVPPTLDVLTNEWRGSFDASAEALAAAARCERELGFPAGEIARRRSTLISTRSEVASLLDALADESHVPLRHPLSAPPTVARMLGLPPRTRACLFDLDGALTGSADVHAAAWRTVLDAFLTRRADAVGNRYAAPYFDLRKDYYGLIHGKPRMDGLRAFLASRGIVLPEGDLLDRPGSATLHGLANQKVAVFERRLARDPAQALRGAHRYLEAAREAGLARAVVSPSANTRAILALAELEYLVPHLVDGRAMEHEGLAAKPAPDTIGFACRVLEVEPELAAAFETLPAGIVAARAAGVGFVVGVDRHHPGRLREAGADVVVADLAKLLDPVLDE
jgi:beta-phosphoglucomutase-like phosphatase (HAD superfamily)